MRKVVIHSDKLCYDFFKELLFDGMSILVNRKPSEILLKVGPAIPLVLQSKFGGTSREIEVSKLDKN